MVSSKEGSLSAASSLDEWLSWQERCHTKEIDLGLTRVNNVFQVLNQGQLSKTIFTITVAGTNGKGSCVAMLEAILLDAGYNVGVYSTPHIHRYNERIRINSKAVDDDVITSAFADINDARAEISLSYFEFGTLAALQIFKQQAVDVQLLEVGLGGRLDAVNIVDADAALVTSIGVDHVDWLGSDVSQIAIEKAGIFRPSQKAVCGAVDVPTSLIDYAHSLETNLLCIGRDFSVDTVTTSDNWVLKGDHALVGAYPLPKLQGNQQVLNAASVITLLAHIAADLPVTKDNIESGLLNTQLKGRLQYTSNNPQLLLDVAHNPQSAQVLADYLKKHHADTNIRAVFSIMSDKDIAQVISPFKGCFKQWYIAPIDSNRSANNVDIQTCLSNGISEDYKSFSTIKQALHAAQLESKRDDLIVCFGSFYVVEACLDAL